MPPGLALRSRLRELQQRHRIVPERRAVPRSPPCDRPQRIVGVAATADLDSERCRLMPGCFGVIKPVQLLYLHQPDAVAGTIEDLTSTFDGRLLLTAVVEHAEARRCNALSIGFYARDYEWLDTDSATFSVLITRAVLTEISLVEAPSNSRCVVTQREGVSNAWMSATAIQCKIARISALLRSELRA
jgi:hypothetical protein